MFGKLIVLRRWPGTSSPASKGELIRMRSKSALVLISIAIVVLEACSASAAAPSTPPAPTQNQAAPAPSQVAVASPSASAVPASSPSPSPAPSATTEPTPSPAAAGAKPTPGSIDPCSLLTAAEASMAIGTKLGAGVSAQLDPDRVCTFKSGLTEVKLILAPPAPDAATAQADWDAERSQVPAGASVKELTDFDRSAYASGSVAGASLSALFVIHGTYFFDFYCGFPKCSQAASLAAAKAIVGRLP